MQAIFSKQKTRIYVIYINIFLIKKARFFVTLVCALVLKIMQALAVKWFIYFIS